MSFFDKRFIEPNEYRFVGQDYELNYEERKLMEPVKKDGEDY